MLGNLVRYNNGIEERSLLMDKTHILSLGLFGYNRSQVDTLLNERNAKINELESQIETMTKELSEAKEALVHFEELEQALTDGILDARIKGQEIVDNSQIEAKLLIDNTNEQVVQYKEEFVHHSRELVSSGSNLRSELNDMKSKMQVIIDQYQNLLDETDFDSLFPKKQVDRLILQVEDYESDDLDEFSDHPKPQEPQLSEDEKSELSRLISEVLGNELGDDDNKKAKKPEKKGTLVDFTTLSRKNNEQ